MTIKFKIARHVKMRGIMTNLSLLLNELKFNIFKKDSCTNPIYFDEKKTEKKGKGPKSSGDNPEQVYP